MAINNNYEYSEENELLYNIDNYSINSGNSIEINNGQASLRNINSNPKSNNFFGNGELGSQTMVGVKPLKPTTMYFRNLIVDDPLYGTHLEGTFGDNGEFSPGDEVILYKKHTCDKVYYDEIGKWDIVTITSKIEDSQGGIRYEIEKPPNNTYDDITANTATAILQFSNLTISGTTFLQDNFHSDSNPFSNDRDMNYRFVAHPEVNAPWYGRLLTEATGILYIKTSEKFTMLKNSRLWNSKGYWGGGYPNGRYFSSTGLLGVDVIPSTWRVPTGFLCSPSNNTNKIIETKDVCDFIGYASGTDSQVGHAAAGGGSFWNEGSNAASIPYLAQKIPMKYKGATDLDKMFFGMPGGFPRKDYETIGVDGGGIIVIQAKEVELQENSYITVAPLQRQSYYNQPSASGAGGTIVLKSPYINSLTEKPFLSTVSTAVNESWSSRNISRIGITNVGMTTLEFETMDIEEVKYSFDELVVEEEILKTKVYDDFRIHDTIPEDTDLMVLTNRLNEYVYPQVDTEYKIQSPETSMSEFEINKFYKIFTTGMHNVDTSLWETINGFEIETTEPDNTEIRFLISRDKGTTWFKLNPESNNFSTVALNNISTGNTKDELTTYINNLVLTSNLLINSDEKTLDIAVGLKTDISYKTPSVDYFKIVYSGIQSPDAPIQILPYHVEEFDADEVNFVFIEPIGVAGSFQNRIQISTTANFEPQQSILDFSNTSVISGSSGKIHIPYQSTQYNNYANNMADLVLPFMLNRGKLPEDTYQELQTSSEFDLDSKVTIKGDIWFHKGNSIRLPDTVIDIPDINAEAPLVHDTSYISGANFKVLLKGATEVTGWNSANIKSVDSDYLGKSSMFTGVSGLSKYGFTKTALPSIVTPGKKTIHFKFKLNASLSSSPLFTFGRTASTIMANVYVSNQYVYVNEAKTQIADINYYGKQQWYDGIEMNVTIVVDELELMKIYVNGYKVMEPTNIYWLNYLDYFTNEAYEEFEYGVNIGCNYLHNGTVSNGFQGNIHEVVCWGGRMFTDTEVMAISKTPNFMLRYDMRDEDYKWVQYPCDDVDIMENNELWNKPYKNDINYSDLNPILLSNPKNKAFDSTHESLLIGNYRPVEIKANGYVSHEPLKHIINGYPYLVNAAMLNDFDRIQLNANNSISTPYLTARNMMLGRVGRIHKDITSTSVEFFYNNTPSTDYVVIGIAYSIFSFNNTFPYWMYLKIYNDGTAEVIMYLHIGSWVTYTKAVNLEVGHRYKLSVEPVNSSFRDDFRIRLYSSTAETFKTNPVISQFSEFHTSMDASWGFNSSSYDDLDYSTSNGNWVEANAILDTLGSDAVSLISLNTYDPTSSITRDSGYAPYYFIEKTLPLSTTTNLVRFVVKSEVVSAMTKVKHILSFDSGVTWKAYSSVNNAWSSITLDLDDIAASAMDDADLYTITNVIALDGGFGDGDIIIRSYLITNETSITPFITSHIIEKNGPRTIDSWISQGSYYDRSYEWFYLNNNSWNPYLEIDTSGGTGQDWKAFGTDVANPTEFKDGAGAKPSTNLSKTYATVKVDCLPKGKWYWRVATYNGLKR